MLSSHSTHLHDCEIACNEYLHRLFGVAVCRDQYGIAPLVKLLEATPYSAITLAAADAVRACAMNSDGNKNAVRENWGIPLLVRMLSAEVRRLSLRSRAILFVLCSVFVLLAVR